MEGSPAILSDCGYDDVISIPEDGKSNAYLFVMKTAGGAGQPGAAEAADTGGSQAGVAAERTQRTRAAMCSGAENEDADLSKYDRVTGISTGSAGGNGAAEV